MVLSLADIQKIIKILIFKNIIIVFLNLFLNILESNKSPSNTYSFYLPELFAYFLIKKIYINKIVKIYTLFILLVHINIHHLKYYYFPLYYYPLVVIDFVQKLF